MKEFFKMLAACLAAFVVVGFGMFFFTLVLAGLLAASAGTPPVVVQRDSMLVFDLSVNIQDSPTAQTGEQIIAEVFGGGGPATLQLRQVVDAIDAAAQDKRIKGVYLHGSLIPTSYGSGYAAIGEVRAALERFRQSGKPVIGYSVAPTARDFLLLSIADRIVLNPMGLTMMPGLSAEFLYLGGTFEKYGIGVQIARAGDYKSAGESFVRSDMSDEEREQVSSLLNGMWTGIVDSVSASRGIDARALQEVIDRNGILSPERALETGLIDQIGDFPGILAELKEITGTPVGDRTFKQVSLKQYIQSLSPDAGRRVRDPQIAVVYAEGQIVNGEGSPGYVGGDRLARELRDLHNEGNVKAVVLRVNSPGGGVMASEMIRREIARLNERMPVVVSMGTLAASGGYWISAGSDRIFAQPNTITGSIGVIAIIPNFQGLAERFALNVESVQTARNAGIFSLMKPRDDEGMAIIQGYVDETYDDFLDLVATGRRIDRSALEPIAGGRVWSGVDALELGLVDEIGGLGDAIAHAAFLAGLEPGDYVVHDHPPARSFLEELVSRLDDRGSPASGRILGSRVGRYIERVARSVEVLDDPRGLYALMPVAIEFN
jgi:protease IV